MTVLAAWLRLDLRRRWRSLAVLVLLIAVASGTVMAALAGARRGASALHRLDARTLPATSAILANTAGFDWNKVRALPEVEALTTFVTNELISIEGGIGDPAAFPPADAATMRTIEKPVVYQGRVFDPARADEVVVSREFVARQHKGVGDTVIVDLATPAELLDQHGSGPGGAYTGPHLTMRIVGVVSSPWFSDTPGGAGILVLSPGVVARFPANTVGDTHNPGYHQFINALVRLRGGEAALPQLRSDVARIAGRSGISIVDLPERMRATQRLVIFEARSLMALGAAAFLAALFLIGQAIARYTSGATAELLTMRALGMTPGQAIATAAAGPAIAGIVGAVLGVAGATAASAWFPIGTGSLLEPNPGVSMDWVVFGPGLAIVVLLAVGGAVAAARLTMGAANRVLKPRRSTIATAVTRANFAIPVVVGTRFALESDRGSSSIPVRPALIGAVTGVAGILAAFTFSHGVSDAASHPERFGQTFQLTAFLGVNGQDFVPADELLTGLRANSDVIGVDAARAEVATGTGGNSSVTLYSYPTGPKPLRVVITDGRMPQTADEVLLAPQSLVALHTAVGRRVVLRGAKGTAMFQVTGSGFIPIGLDNTYADGGWVTDSGYDSVFKSFKFHIALVSLRPSAHTPDAGARLAAALIKADPGLASPAFDTRSFATPAPPTEVAELRQVRVLPIILGCFLALLAIGAVGHAVATAARRRARDLAVLRALGMTQRQCRGVVLTQASVLTAVGLVFGVPLGVALGRTAWRVGANYTPVQYISPTAVWALALVGPAGLLATNLLAALVGHRAARRQVAHILRTE